MMCVSDSCRQLAGSSYLQTHRVCLLWGVCVGVWFTLTPRGEQLDYRVSCRHLPLIKSLISGEQWTGSSQLTVQWKLIKSSTAKPDKAVL